MTSNNSNSKEEEPEQAIAAAADADADAASATNNQQQNGNEAMTTTTAAAAAAAETRELTPAGQARQDYSEARLRHWRESPFAVGLTNITWADDRIHKSRSTRSRKELCCSAYVCGCLGAGRVGNMAVFLQTTETYDHVIANPSTGFQSTRRRRRPKLLWLVGPYWPVNIFITYPLILGISIWTAITRVQHQPIGVMVTWSATVLLLVFALAMVACRDPGIMYRHDSVPQGAENWRWNDQAQTYRPRNARFDPECGVVVEGFDHTCPWTGTAIGSKNMFWFKVFVFTLPVCIVYDIVLHIFTIGKLLY